MKTTTMMSLLPRDGESATSDFKEYYYSPSMPAAIIFIILFTLSTVLHLFQMIRTKTWFMIPFCIGGIFESIGYIGRAISASENPGPYSTGPFILQSILLLVAPALFAASIYMELGRVAIMLDAESRLLVRRGWLTKIFVGGDVLSFLLQAGGAGLLASKSTGEINAGQKVVVGGLFVQLVFFGLFVVVGLLFHRRVRLSPTPAATSTPWTKHMVSLYIVSILIFIRSVVRVVEFIQGYSGYIYTHEAFLYVFDAAVMFLAVVTMNVIHPSEVAQNIREKKMLKESDSQSQEMAFMSF